MLILHDHDTLLHETVELLGSKLIPALESPERIRAIVQACKANESHEVKIISTSEIDADAVMKFARATHDADYLDHIRTVFTQWSEAGLVGDNDSVLPECFRLHNSAAPVKPPKDIYARAGYYAFDMSTGITQNSWRSVVASANLAIQAVNHLLAQESRHIPVVALCRPPGHHCTPSQAGGYCYVNNIAVAITALRQYTHTEGPGHVRNLSIPSQSHSKFAILDIDFHHGNGTQEIFWNDHNVLYVSIHGEDEFPYYTGSAAEMGPDAPHPAHKTNLNLPLAPGSSINAYLEKLQQALSTISAFGADYLLVSLGFDTFHLDPLGKFSIETSDYAKISSRIGSEIALPTVILLEGGYVIDRLGQNLLTFLDGWGNVGHTTGNDNLR